MFLKILTNPFLSCVKLSSVSDYLCRTETLTFFEIQSVEKFLFLEAMHRWQLPLNLGVTDGERGE